MIFNFFIYILILVVFEERLIIRPRYNQFIVKNCVECHVCLNNSGVLELDFYENLMQRDSHNGLVFNADGSL